MIDTIFNYYEQYGNHDYIGEEVSQISHMIQAAMLAEDNNESIEIVLACLFHDIGHLLQIDSTTNKMNKYGTKYHEKIGKQFLLDCNIPEPIPSLVQNHVKAKKYLVSTQPNYFNTLSNASKQTFIFQGGIMNKREIQEFEQDELFEMSLKVRFYDDKAKVSDIKIKNLDNYKKMLIKYLNK